MTSQRSQKTRATRTTEHSTMRTERALDMPGSTTTTDQRPGDGRSDSQTAQTRQSGRRRQAAVALLVGLLAPLVMALFGPLSSASAEDPDEEGKFSFYNLSSDLSAYFSNANSPDGAIDNQTANRLGPGWSEMLKRPGDAGSLIGYVDPDFSFGLDWLNSRISGSSDARSYESFQARDGSGEATDAYEGLQTYVYYGAALNELGLDSTTTASGSFVKVIAGGLVWVGYLIAAGVPFLFAMVIQLLQAINPFRWFYTAVSAYAPTWAEGMTGGQGVPNWADGISTFIGQWYGFLNTLAWTVILPLFVAFFVLGLVMWTKAGERGSALKRLAIRFVFILVGVPLIGSMYTSVLNKMEDSLSGASPGATQLVLSTYVDFDRWMLNNRLAIPESAEYAIAWNSDKGGPTSDSQMRVRSTALAINLASSPAKYKDIDPIGASSSAVDTWAASSVPDVEGGGAANDVDEGGAFVGTLALLTRYMLSDNISAADFESAAKGELSQNKGALDQEDAETWFNGEELTKEDAESGSKAPKSKVVGNPVIALPTGESGLDSDNQGNKNGPVQRFKTNSPARCGTAIATDDGKPMHCNLSPLAAYNYLSTSFGPDSLTLYSSDKSTSGFTTETHSAVTQVGAGPAKFMYWVNVLVILWSLVAVGIAYSLGMLANSFKRTFEAVAAIPFAMVGSIAGIAKVLIYSIALILEVLVTLFLYQFVSAVLVGLPTIVEGPVTALTSGDGALSSGLLSAAGGYLVVFLTLVSTGIVLAFTIVALRLRKSVLSALNESVTKMIDKFMDAGIAAPGAGGGMVPALAGGVGTGVGMAAASKMASPGASKGPAGSGGSGPTKTGGMNAKPVALGGGTGSGGPGGTGSGGSGPAPTSGTGGSSAGGSGSDGSAPGVDSAPGAVPTDTDSGTSVVDGSAHDSSRAVEADKTVAEKVGKQGKLTRLRSAARTPAGQAAMMGAAGAAPGGKGTKGVVGAAVGSGGSVAAAKAARKRLDKSTAAQTMAPSARPTPTAVPDGRATQKPTKKAAPAVPSVKTQTKSSSAQQQSNEATKQAVVTGVVKGAPGGPAGVAASVGREVATQRAAGSVAEKAQGDPSASVTSPTRPPRGADAPKAGSAPSGGHRRRSDSPARPE